VARQKPEGQLIRHSDHYLAYDSALGRNYATRPAIRPKNAIRHFRIPRRRQLSSRAAFPRRGTSRLAHEYRWLWHLRHCDDRSIGGRRSPDEGVSMPTDVAAHAGPVGRPGASRQDAGHATKSLAAV